MPILNWNISFGNLLTIASIVFAGGVFYSFTQNLAGAIKDIKENLKVLNQVVMDVALSTQRQDNFEARTDDRFKRIEDDIREMKHGHGFIKAAGAAK